MSDSCAASKMKAGSAEHARSNVSFRSEIPKREISGAPGAISSSKRMKE